MLVPDGLLASHKLLLIYLNYHLITSFQGFQEHSQKEKLSTMENVLLLSEARGQNGPTRVRER